MPAGDAGDRVSQRRPGRSARKSERSNGRSATPRRRPKLQAARGRRRPRRRRLALAVAGGALVVVLGRSPLATGHRRAPGRQALMRGVDRPDRRHGLQAQGRAHPGRLRRCRDGRHPADAAGALPGPADRCGLDLNDLRARVESVGWVKEAKVVRLLPDTLFIAVKERPRLAVWRACRRDAA